MNSRFFFLYWINIIFRYRKKPFPNDAKFYFVVLTEHVRKWFLHVSTIFIAIITSNYCNSCLELNLTLKVWYHFNIHNKLHSLMITENTEISKSSLSTRHTGYSLVPNWDYSYTNKNGSKTKPLCCGDESRM